MNSPQRPELDLTRPPERPEFDFTSESTIEKLARKSKDNPFMVLGLAGCLFVATVGLYRFKYRGNLSASNYLMQLRVTAQGTVIGCLSIGVIKSIYDKLKRRYEKRKKAIL